MLQNIALNIKIQRKGNLLMSKIKHRFYYVVLEPPVNQKVNFLTCVLAYEYFPWLLDHACEV